jgi:hypothetical protein
MPGETHFFDDIYSRRSELGDPGKPEDLDNIARRLDTLYARYNEPADQRRVAALLSDESVVRDFRARCKTYRDVLTSFMQLQMKHEGKARWGNNTPRDIFNMREILAFYPDAKILVCVRDLKDFLSSYEGKWRVTADQERVRLRQLYHPVLTSLLWKTSVRMIPSIQSRVPAGNFMIVRYEELAQDAEKTVRGICATIEEEFESEMLTVNYSNSSSPTTTGGIYASSVGVWRRRLPGEDVCAGQLIARNELSWLGYSIEKVAARRARVLMLFVTFPFALTRALYVNRWKRGHLLSYLERRVRGLFTAEN